MTQLKIKTAEQRSNDLSFFEHLDELRSRLIKSIVFVILGACLFYQFIDKVFIFITKPVGKLVFTSPADAFIARLTLTLLGGLIISLPFVLYQVWQFVATGLKDFEKKYIIVFCPVSFFLFIVGALFAYFIALPISLHFFLSFSTEYIVPMITIKAYISFIGTLVLAFGIIFELPLILMFLTKVGIATPEFLAQKRKYAVVIILIVSALITPPDFITQIIMAVPLIILYEIGVLVSKITAKKSQLNI